MPKPTTKTITDYIDAFLAAKVSEAQSYDPLYGELLGVVKDLIQRGGKRLRPTLCMLAYAAFGGSDSNALIPIAASQELFHAFLLMHDDIIDRDVVRWGGPNVSGYYERSLANKLSARQAHHMADSSALLAGDLCHGFAQEMILTSKLAPGLRLEAARMLQQTLFETMAGELVDMHLPNEPWESMNLERIMAASAHKTALYSFATPLSLGALCAGASKKQLKILTAFALELGIAFQLRDDMLGMFGDEKALGKSVLSDMREGKQTMLTYYGYKFGGTTQKKQLTSLIGKPDSSYLELQQVQQILVKTGAVAKTEKAIKRHADKAFALFETLKASDASLGKSSALKELQKTISVVIGRVN